MALLAFIILLSLVGIIFICWFYLNSGKPTKEKTVECVVSPEYQVTNSGVSVQHVSHYSTGSHATFRSVRREVEESNTQEV